jgi:hypothetical protein
MAVCDTGHSKMTPAWPWQVADAMEGPDLEDPPPPKPRIKEKLDRVNIYKVRFPATPQTPAGHWEDMLGVIFRGGVPP